RGPGWTEGRLAAPASRRGRSVGRPSPHLPQPGLAEAKVASEGARSWHPAARMPGEPAVLAAQQRLHRAVRRLRTGCQTKSGGGEEAVGADMGKPDRHDHRDHRLGETPAGRQADPRYEERPLLADLLEGGLRVA